MQGASLTSARVEITHDQDARGAVGRIEVNAVSRPGMAIMVMSETLLLRLYLARASTVTPFDEKR